jgi:hypothetical protein
MQIVERYSVLAQIGRGHHPKVKMMRGGNRDMTLYRSIQLSTLFFTLLLANGCGPLIGRTLPADTIRAHYEAMNREDLDEAMSYIEEGPNRTATRIATEQALKNYDLQYSVEIVGSYPPDSKGEVGIKVIQTTKKIAGGPFVDNRTTIVYTMKEVGLSWKMASAEVKEIERL